MRRSLLLFLSVDHLHAQRMEGNTIAAQHTFPHTPEGREKFFAFVEGVNYPCYLLTDLIEEDFRHESIPHLAGKSRTALLKRKFEQFYRATPYHQATFLQRQKVGRRDDDVLFSALTNPSLITPWVEILSAKKIPLAGIFSVPQISKPLIKNHPSKHLLLISWEKFSGLRQTYFSDHHLQISRLTPVHNEQAFHDSVVKELLRTYQYLKSLSLLPAGESLDVYVLCNADDRNELFNRLTVSVDMRYDFADINAVGKQLGVQEHIANSDATQIFLRQLVKNPPSAHYANAGHTFYYTLWNLNRTLWLAAGLLFAVALVWSFSNVWRSNSAVEGRKSLQLAAQLASEETQKIVQSFPNTYAAATDMKSGVTVMRKLGQYGAEAETVLQPVSSMLNHYPKIEVDTLTWQTEAAGFDAPGTRNDVPAQVATIKGHLTGFADDYRGALNYVEQFQSDLTAQGFQVAVVDKPFDASSGGNIADQGDARKNSLDFSLKIARRPNL
jgi:hypothetical protein